MKFAVSLLVSTFLCVSSVFADNFGSGADSFDIEFVTIGNPNNVADTTGDPNPAGSVSYTYRMGKYEISEQMIDKANASGLLGITKDTRGPDKPATRVTWFEAAQFVNWLNIDANSSPAYKFDGSGNFQLWAASDPGYNPNNLYRNSQAKYFLPSLDEWYKAAYYDPTSGVYYDYPTGSDSEPDGIDVAGDTNFDAVFPQGASNSQPNDIANVGVSSPYGTAGQGGNVFEWEETDQDLENDSSSSFRVVRGGFWSGGFPFYLSPSFRIAGNPAESSSLIGFRVASISETFLPGDFDFDGDVDGRDFLAWQRNPSVGNLADWQENYGMGTLSAITAVPEPSTALLACASLMLCMVRGARFAF